MKVKITYGDKEGYVEYNAIKKEINVVFPDDKIEAEVDDYLRTKQVYWIPESQRIDDYREELAYPFDSLTHFELAMNTLWANTGVYVQW